MNFEPFSDILGLELRFLEEDLFSCSYVQLHREGPVFDIIQKHHGTGTLVIVLSKIPRKFPVALVMSGRGLLHKSINTAISVETDIFNKAFPAIDRNDFYEQVYQEEENVTISIVRKQQVDQVLTVLKQAGLKVLTVSLGGVVGTQLFRLMEKPQNEIAVDVHRFSLVKDFLLSDYRDSGKVEDSTVIKIGDETVPDAQAISYAAGLQVFLHRKLEVISVNQEETNAEFAYFLETVKLKKQGLFFMAFLFISLLISFLVFSVYNEKNSKLSSEVGQVTAAIDQIGMLESTIQKNEAATRKLHWNGGYNYGFLVNEIAKTKPKQLQLVALDFKPASDQAEGNAAVVIFGHTGNLQAVNNWIYLLKEMKWAKLVKLVSYREDSNTGDYNFEIKMFY